VFSGRVPASTLAYAERVLATYRRFVSGRRG
jgi:hypothetical protein